MRNAGILAAIMASPGVVLARLTEEDAQKQDHEARQKAEQISALREAEIEAEKQRPISRQERRYLQRKALKARGYRLP